MGYDSSGVGRLAIAIVAFSLLGCGDGGGGGPICSSAVQVDVAPGGPTEVMVPMRDCVVLATDLYVPEGEGPHPAILIRLPYDKRPEGGAATGLAGSDGLLLLVRAWRGMGYAVIVQDTRGRFASGGEWRPLENEETDGIDTVTWLEAQSWFDGNMALFGGSYFGYTQLAIAHQRPASLRAMIALVTPSNVPRLFFEHGVGRADILVGWSYA